MPWRYPGIETVAIQPDRTKESSPCFLDDPGRWGQAACFLTRGHRTNTLLWGDSFANHYAAGLRDNPLATTNVLEYSSPACPPIFNYAAVSNPRCAAMVGPVAQIIRRYSIRTVVLAARWSLYVSRRRIDPGTIAQTVQHLHELGTRVVLIGQSPVFNFAYPDEYFYLRYGADQRDVAFYAPAKPSDALNDAIFRAAHADMTFNPSDTFCMRDQCLLRLRRQYTVLDLGHLSGFGSKLAADALLRAMNQKFPN
jgi:hypothetical protein